MEDKRVLNKDIDSFGIKELGVKDLEGVAGGNEKIKIYICSQCGEEIKANIEDSLRTVYMAHIQNCKGRKI